ncbi:MAG: acylhydrolase [Lachnospiraceae bacterium]|nr:acylhydrolase [Lachnospiraceae bacterium]
MKKIICFGDSNTYGYNPETGGRYDENTRWPKLLAKSLGDGYEVFEEGQNGRTIANDDPWEGGTKCGLDYVLPMIESKKPVDLLIIMLGSNDLKLKFSLPPADIAGSLIKMISDIRGYCDHFIGCPDLRILIIAPPAFTEPFSESYFASFFGKEDAVARSKELAKWYELVAEQNDCYFLNATKEVAANSCDHLHMSPADHKKLAELVKDKITDIFKES